MARKQASTDIPAQSSSTAESRREALLDAEARDSPVLTLIAKRLRAARKKIKRVEEIEAIKAAGREINADQEEVLKGKAKNAATIEELEKLFPLLREAVTDEVSQKLSAKAKEIERVATGTATAKAAEEARITAEEQEVERAKAVAMADELRAKVEEATQKAASEEVRRAEEKAANDARLVELQNAERTSMEEAVMRLLQLIYFSKLFSKEGRPENEYVHQMEREACLTYNSTVNFAGDSLRAHDLDAICLFGSMVTTRPDREIISHETALERCKALALNWVNAAETSIPHLNTTVDELVVKFERIVGSGYYSIKPEMKGAHEVVNPSAAFRPEGAVPTPPARDVNASNAYSSNAAFLHTQQPPALQASNNMALQQLLYQRPSQVRLAMLASEALSGAESRVARQQAAFPSQVPLEGQPSLEHSTTTSFVPSLSAGLSHAANASFPAQSSSGFTPSMTAGFVLPSSSGFAPGTSSAQPPGFEPVAAQKAPAMEANGTAPPQHLAAVFQGTHFGAITKADLTGAAPVPAPIGNNNPTQAFAEVPPTAAAGVSTVPAKQVSEDDLDGFVDRAPERKSSATHNPLPGGRGRFQPVEPVRGGRGPVRGRNGPGRGDYAVRGGGRRSGQGRGFRGGRGRDFPHHFGQQPVTQAGGY